LTLRFGRTISTVFEVKKEFSDLAFWDLTRKEAIMRRREFLKLGAVAGGTVLLGGTGRFGSLFAAPKEIPTVDRLVVTNLVDNVYDIFAKGGRIGNITITRNTLPYPYGSDVMLLSEHGLAFHLQSFRGDEEKQILLDFALTPRTLTNNYQGLRVDPAKADALIISHGHVDHFGGLLDVARSLQGRAKPGLTLYAGGPDTFCHRWVVQPDGKKLDYGELKRDELESRGLNVVIAEEPTTVTGHAITSGHIARVTDFEMTPPAARLEAGATGSACDATLHFPPGTVKIEAKPGDLVKDIFWGEHATAYNVKDRGLVVISSCGHAGIINSVRQIQKSTGIEKVHAVVGGWHLAPYPDDIIAKTVQALKEINPDYLIPMHCTGFRAMMAVQQEMPQKLIMPSTGTSVVFGA
jgi:7,8-dihydropterin-6-yl-methyl-4-(beta-D-ribofuranosyl)aminobenzene 5'-phosphate synthase